jgi:hypothetical protein
MRVKTEVIEVPVPSGRTALPTIERHLYDYKTRTSVILRWGIIRRESNSFHVEVAILNEVPETESKRKRDSLVSRMAYESMAVAIVIPTGVGAHIGGHIGDASSLVRVLEALGGSVITHPNVVNAADFYGSDGSAYYVDGLTLDEFLLGNRFIKRIRRPRIGVILDRLPRKETSRLLNAVNACSVVRGIDVIGYRICAEKVVAKVNRSKYDHYLGEIENIDTLVDAANSLQNAGANCIAVATDVLGPSETDWKKHYFSNAPNPIGAVEALISRTITYCCGLPCAHAPASTSVIPDLDEVVDPRAAAEPASGSGLPCILEGLSRGAVPSDTEGLHVTDLDAIVIPGGCAGGVPALGSVKFGIPLVAIAANNCTVGVSAADIACRTTVPVQNCAEAIGYIAAAKAGVSWLSLRSGQGAFQVPEI